MTSSCPSKDHPIAGPYGRDMDVPRQFKVGFDGVFFIQYPVTFDRDISIIYSSAFSAFSLDSFPVIQHSFPFNKMVVSSQTIQFRVYSIMRDFQHMFCNRFVHTSALKYDNGLVPCRQQVILISNCDPCHWCIQMSWENKAEGFPQPLYAFSLLNIELYDCKYTMIKMTHEHEIQCTLDISQAHFSWEHKIHPIARPHRRGMGVPCGFKFCLAVVLC